MKENLKLYDVSFEPMWPVPHGLIIAANNEDEAREIALKELKEAGVVDLNIKLYEIKVEEPCVVFFESGDY